MCGISGIFSLTHSRAELGHISQKMRDVINYRGPDSAGAWECSEVPLALGHRRLAILDLTPEGHQPMRSSSGRFTIVFNGEVYNYQQLRSELEPIGAVFRSNSDTEVLLAAFEHYGVEAAVHKFNGMFALAVYDAEHRSLTLMRDRLGVKPLYYAVMPWGCAFASELKSFREISGVEWAVSKDSTALMLRYGYVPQPHTIYEGIYKLLAGSILSISLENFKEESSQFSPFIQKKLESCAPRQYWSVENAVTQAQNNIWRGSYEEGVNELETLLLDSVRLRMVADVPLGAFLSGGIDSSLVVALMQKQSTTPVKTFTVGFREDGFNEAQYAKEVAEHLGTEHTEVFLEAKDAYSIIPQLPAMFDEPFADSSQIPTYLVAKIAREHVTVSLSGDGGDEFFAGYSRFEAASRIWNKLDKIPYKIRQLGSALSARASIELKNSIFGSARAGKLERFASLAQAKTCSQLYSLIMSCHDESTTLVPGAKNLGLLANDKDLCVKDIVDVMMYMDTVSYLPDDILVKVDRATMAVSLEAREPLLDYRLLELAWRFPQEWKLKDGKGKLILRSVLHRYVPSTLIDRPKMGFSVPVGEWLKGPLRSWAEDLLSPEKLQRSGTLSTKVVRNLWESHIKSEYNRSALLWNILMYQAWQDSIYRI
jgi:asparagine synthase (glutamine-hydrolysing)